MNIAKILIMSVFVEALITYAKEMFVNKKLVWQMLASALLGIFIAIAFDIDLPKLFELESTIPFVGNVITGIIISRGSNYVADIIKKAQSYLPQTEYKDVTETSERKL